MPAEGHTPGPWWLDEVFGSVWSEDRVNVVAVCGPNAPLDIDLDWSEWQSQRKANARLIAASPALLAACKAAKELIQYPSGKTAEQRNEVLDQVAAAIKAAKGTG